MTKSLAKTLLILSSVVLIALLIIGIVQSFQISALRNQANIVSQKAQEMQTKLEEVDKEIEYRESEEYYKDYYEQEKKYGEEGDKIYQIV